MCSIPARQEVIRTCLTSLRRSLDEVEALAAEHADPAGAVELLDGLLAASTRAQGLVATLVGRVDAEGAWRTGGYRTVRPWLISRTTLGSGAVSRLLDQAGADTLCPLMAQAWRDGRVTWEHVRVVREAHRRYPRLSSSLRECEPQLVDAAEKVDPGVLSHELFDLLHRLDPDHVTDRENDRFLDAAFRASTLLDGWVKVDGLLPPDVGQALCAALAAARARCRSSATDGSESAAGDGHSAGAGGAGSVDDAHGAARRASDHAQPSIDPVSAVRASRRNVDALALILSAAASAHGPDGLPSRHGSRPVTHVHVSAESLTSGTAPGWIEAATGGRLIPVTAAAAERLSCDAVRRVLVTAENGTVDAISILNRTVPGMMRRVIVQRDHRVCRFPGCDSAIHEVHHVVPWSRGGRTTSSNLIGLCYFHHHLVHDGGWTLDGDANRQITIRSPRGQSLRSPVPSEHRRC